MIVQISKMSTSYATPLSYNQRKVAAGVAKIVDSNRLLDKTIEAADLMLGYYDNKYTNAQENKKLGFQLVISPGPNEYMPDEKAAELARDILKDIEMDEQPWIMFKHEDTGHVHYHLVSTRAKRDGTLAYLKYSNLQVQQSMKNHAKDYGFVIGKDPKYKSEYKRVNRFDQKHGDIQKQFVQLFGDALKYNYRDYEQFRSIMKSLRVSVRENTTGGRIVFCGMTANGKQCTEPAWSLDDGTFLEKINAAQGGIFRKVNPSDRKTLEEFVERAFYTTDSYQGFKEYLRGNGIEALPGKRKRTRDFEDFTFVDHKTKTVLNLSEFLEGFTLETFNYDCRNGRWSDEKVFFEELHERNFKQKNPREQEKNEQKRHNIRNTK